MKEISVICFGEILWDNIQEGRRLGGAPLNVCYHLKKMNINSKIISAIGNDPDGRELLNELKKLGINSIFCQVSDVAPTSQVHVNVKEDHSVAYEIVENVAWDYIRSDKDLENLVAASDALVFGSLVTRSEISRNTLFTLIEKSRRRVFDVNLRVPFYDKDTIMGLMAKTHLLKLNVDELDIIMDWFGVKSSAELIQLESIQHRFPEVDTIILTKGADGATYYSNGDHLSVQAMKVNVQDTVGSGDAFLAAFLAARLQNSSIPEALEQANVLSGFIASQPGACPEYKIQDLHNFKHNSNV